MEFVTIGWCFGVSVIALVVWEWYQQERAIKLARKKHKAERKARLAAASLRLKKSNPNAYDKKEYR